MWRNCDPSPPTSAAASFSILPRDAICVQVLAYEERYKVLLDVQAGGPIQTKRKISGTTHLGQNTASDSATAVAIINQSLTSPHPDGGRTSETRWLSPNVTRRTPGLRQSKLGVPSRTRSAPRRTPWNLGPATARAGTLPGART